MGITKEILKLIWSILRLIGAVIMLIVALRYLFS